jgi:hypothetical protein
MHGRGALSVAEKLLPASAKGEAPVEADAPINVDEKQLLAPVAEEVVVEADATPFVAEKELAGPVEGEDFKGTAAGIADKAKESAEYAKSAVSDATSKVKDTASDAASETYEAAKSVKDAAAETIESAAEKCGKLLDLFTRSCKCIEQGEGNIRISSKRLKFMNCSLCIFGISAQSGVGCSGVFNSFSFFIESTQAETRSSFTGEEVHGNVLGDCREQGGYLVG